jgi:hypothetical protein
MAMLPAVYSINGLATELACNPRKLAKALTGVPPDGKVGLKQVPAWRITSALQALAAYDGQDVNSGNRNGSRANGGGSDLDRTLDDLEGVGRRLEGAFERLEAERDLDKRRAQARHIIGPVLREFEAALEANAAALPPHLAALTAAARREMFGGAIGRAMAILHLQLAQPSEPQ